MRHLLVTLCLAFCVLFGFSQDPINITQIEYFYDTDPGFGNANQLSFSQDQQVELNFTLDISSLSPGIHSMYVRAKDEIGNWSLYTKRNIFIIEGNQDIPNLVELEYFWDIDPGFGNGINLPISSNTSVDQNFTIPINSLSQGIHSLYIRSKDAYNRWSLYTKKNIYIIEGNQAVPNIVALEYFFNTDPGLGNATALSVTPNTALDENFVIPLTGLTGGDHELYIRAQDDNGRWSLYSQNTITVGSWNCNYTDVPIGHVAFDAVQDLCSREILDDDGEAEPEALLNRAELAKLAYLGVGLQNNPTADSFPSPFNDLQDEDIWYYSFAKNLAYIEFDDHTAPFDRNFLISDLLRVLQKHIP